MRSLTLVFLLGLFLAARADALDLERVNAVVSAMKNLGSGKVSPSAIPAVRSYLTRSESRSVQDGVDLIIRPSLRSKAGRLRRELSRIRIDGRLNDWKSSEAIVRDEALDTRPIDDSRPMGEYRKSDDLELYGCLKGARYVYCMLKARAMPVRRATYHYRVNFLTSDGKLKYAIVWSNYGNVIQEWDTETSSFVRNLSSRGSAFSKGRVFEARVPLRVLRGLPERARLEGAVWHEFKNMVDFKWDGRGLTSSSKYHNYSLEILARYASLAELRPDDPFPLAQAIVDAFPYYMADSGTRTEIISDGLAMVSEASASEEYKFDGQKRLHDLDFEEILAWSDRSLMYGTDDMEWKFRGSFSANKGKMNMDMYHFMFLQPETLREARTVLAANNLIAAGNLSAVSRNIEAWLQTIWKYRANGDVIPEACAHGGEYWCKVLAEYQDEIARNDITVASIGPDSIFKWQIMSAPFQVHYIADHGFYFGNCGDTTVLGLAFARAIGLPAVHIHYDTITNGKQNVVHSFPAYYSSSANRYIPFSPGNNGLPQWKLGGAESDRVYYFVEAPVATTLWSYGSDRLSGAEWMHSSNQCPSLVTVNEWENINFTGLASEEVRKCVMVGYDR